MEHLSLVENVDNLFRSLEDFTQKEGVIGKPVTQNQKTFLPIVSVTVGYGGGNAAMTKGQTGTATMGTPASDSGGTGALGMGAKLSTEAIIVIDDQNQDVSVLPMSTAGAGQIMDKIPQILTGIKNNQPANS